MTKPMNTWEERLLELHAVNNNMYIGVGGCDECLEWDEAVKELTDFIQAELQRQRESIVEEIKKLKRIDKSIGDYEWTKNIGYNDAIDDIIKKVGKHD